MQSKEEPDSAQVLSFSALRWELNMDDSDAHICRHMFSVRSLLNSFVYSQIIVPALCAEDCGPRGICHEGECLCEPGWGGPDCAAPACDPESCKVRLESLSSLSHESIIGPMPARKMSLSTWI